jgi:site-specific recombinase XerD
MELGVGTLASKKSGLAEAIDQYIASRRAHCAAKTIIEDQYILRRVLRTVGDLQVGNLRAHHVENLFGTLTQEHRTQDGRVRAPIAASSWNNLYSRLTQFSGWLQQRGLLRDDLMRLVRPRKQEQKIRLQPTPAQLWDLFDAPSDLRDRAVLAIAGNTGLRANEIAALRVRDVRPP